jgi:Peptidase family S51
VHQRDREYGHAEREHDAALDELRRLYLTQLDHALRAAYDVAQRSEGRPRLRESALADAVEVVRLIDRQHGDRVRGAEEAFDAAWRPQERPAIAQHREEVRHLLAEAEALAIAGGHVGELARVLRLFDVRPHLPRALIGWSAGAMVLCDQIVLFHDFVAQGVAQTEVFGDGLGVAQGVVALPHARRRLRVTDPVRMSVLARRFRPARCLVLDDAVVVRLTEDGGLPADARLVAEDGTISGASAA